MKLIMVVVLMAMGLASIILAEETYVGYEMIYPPAGQAGPPQRRPSFYTNVPEVAQTQRLQINEPPSPSVKVNGVEMYGNNPGDIEDAQRAGAFRPSTPPGNLNPQTKAEAQAEIQRMITVGRSKGYADNDILADIRERGLDKIGVQDPSYLQKAFGR